jgi:Subtilase family
MSAARLAAALVCSLIPIVGSCSPSWAQNAGPRLAPADSLASSTHLILTVPLDDPAALAAKTSAIESRFGIRLAAEWPLRSIAVHCLVMDVSGTADMEGLMARMRADGDIRTVQRMQDFNLFTDSHRRSLVSAQTALSHMNVLAAHRVSKGAGVKVAVVDTAIDADHPDLAGRVTKRQDFVADAQMQPAEAHGTAVAAIIAADAADGKGMLGVAPAVELIGLRACWQDGASGHCNSFSLARALNVAVLDAVDIVNMSLGGPADPLLGELVEAAIGKGIVVVAAQGEGETPAFPASAPGVIAVGRGRDAVPAPSIDVISAAPGNGYRYVSGSSIAAAHIAGIAALMRAAQPALRGEELATALHGAVTMQGTTAVPDACRAVQAVVDRKMDCRQ